MDIIFSERLKAIMEERGMTSKQLSQATGISLNSIYAWQKEGKYKIYLSNLIKLCDALKCSIDFLVGRSEAILDYIPQICPPFYERLRGIMANKGISRYCIANETKIYDNYFTVWKKGRDPQLLTLIELADYLGCTLDYLVGRDR